MAVIYKPHINLKMEEDGGYLLYVLNAHNIDEENSCHSAFMINKDADILQQLEMLNRGVKEIIKHMKNKIK